jgi:glycosyltransferase involved in cell wall biosynthesis
MLKNNISYCFYVDKINEKFPGLSKLIFQIKLNFDNVSIINDLDEVDSYKEIIPLGTVAAHFYLKKFKKGKVAFIIDAYTLGFLSVAKFYIKRKDFFNKHLFGALLRYIKYYFIEKNIIRNFEKVIVVSEHDAFYLKKKFQCSNIEVVSNGADFPDLSLKKNKDFDFSLGILAYWGAGSIKDVNWFIEDYYPKLRNIFPEIKLITAGRGANAETLAYFKKNGIIHIGEIDSLWEFFNNIDIYITTLRKECGILNKVLDAMAHEKIVLGLNHNLYAFKNLKNGFITYNSFDELVQAIEKIRDNKIKIEEIQRNAYNYVKNHHNWQCNYNRLKDILDLHYNKKLN